jgi:hypothetical protein
MSSTTTAIDRIERLALFRLSADRLSGMALQSSKVGCADGTSSEA